VDDVMGPDVGAEDFWAAADRSRAGRRAEVRPGRPSLRARAAAAWTAEVTAMRALRSRATPGAAAASGPAARSADRRKRVGVAVACVAALAALVAVGDAMRREGPPREAAAGADDGREGELVSTGSDGSSADPTAGGTVPSEIIDAPLPEPPVKVRAAQTTPKAAAAASTTTIAPSAPKPASPTPRPPTPATVPTTTAPRPATPPPAAPPTTAPKPPAPRVDSFTATVASKAGGDCPALQWATTFRWSTTGATSVAITGLLETAQRNLPADGTKVVCRALPAGPLGGWTLTATGPGGTATRSS
jgi:hypothetical protein